MLSNALQTQQLPINDIKPYARHAREHNRAQRRKLKHLIAHFGQVVPITIDGTNTIVDGHMVWQVMKDSGYQTIAAIRVEGRTDPEIRALRKALNRVAQESRWNKVALKAEFEELIALSFDMSLTGFDPPEFDMSLSLDMPEANVAEDGIPQTPIIAITRPGDSWTLGVHRIRCGDALSSSDLETLMAGEVARMVFTDPPYNVPVDGFVSGLGEIKHREFSQASGEMTDEQFTAFLTSAISNMDRHVCAGGLHYLFMDWRHLWHLLQAGRSNKLDLLNMCVWAKTNAGMGSLYRSQHELVVVFKSGTAPHYNNVELGRHGRSRSNLWTYRGLNSFSPDRKELLESHPTVKPVLLISDAIKDVTKRGDIVLDPFLGSGSTLVAAEETGRICRGIEIDPAYIDVAILRWQKLAGRDAVNIETGETFDEVSEKRHAEEARHG